jgi:hypothetical protein
MVSIPYSTVVKEGKTAARRLPFGDGTVTSAAANFR